MTDRPKDYARVWLDGGGDPTFDQIDGFLFQHFNARAVYVGDIQQDIRRAGHEGWTRAEVRQQAEQARAEVEQVRLVVRAAVAELLLTWAETTHGNDFGHDHHCPLSSFRDKKGPWADDNANPERCTCGWSAFRNAYDTMQAALIGEPK